LYQLALAEERVRRFANPAFMATIAAHRASIWRAQGNHAFLAWLNDRHPRSEEPLTAVRDTEYLTLVRGLIDTNQVSAALGWIDRLAAFAQDTGRIRSEVDMLVLRVMALQHQGEARTAHTALVRALALAAPMGYVSIFVAEGAPMAALLTQVARGAAPVAAYAASLLEAFPRTEPREWRHPVLSPQSSALIEPLSARELEILRLIADGQSNQVIAGRLVIAVSTVKRHINNIYGKLDVQSRTQALVRARELQIL
jgi:LuxR family transcriptional regulator, maltose regulon positive regulatory protein